MHYEDSLLVILFLVGEETLPPTRQILLLVLAFLTVNFDQFDGLLSRTAYAWPIPSFAKLGIFLLIAGPMIVRSRLLPRWLPVIQG